MADTPAIFENGVRIGKDGKTILQFEFVNYLMIVEIEFGITTMNSVAQSFQTTKSNHE